MRTARFRRTSSITRTIGGCGERMGTQPRDPVPLKYFSAWFCPYAHRATLALSHHAPIVQYEWEEALGWEKRASRVGEAGSDASAPRDAEFYYHWKAPKLLEYNASGLVPTLVDEATGRAVTESLVCLEFVDELAASAGAADETRLIPNDPFEAARCRVWADKVNKYCCSPYYGVLVKADEEGRRESFATLLKGLREFAAAKKGDFFSGAAPSIVDYALLPWAWRYYVLAHYKGKEFAIPHTEDLAPFHAWLAAMEALPQVASTLPGKERYLEHVAKYAEASARSKVANAVRRGAEAHEIDDEKDESV